MTVVNFCHPGGAALDYEIYTSVAVSVCVCVYEPQCEGGRGCVGDQPRGVCFSCFVDQRVAPCVSLFFERPPFMGSYCTSLCTQSKCSLFFPVFSHLPAANPPPLSLRYLNERWFAAFVPATCVSLVLFAHKQKPKPSLVALH